MCVITSEQLHLYLYNKTTKSLDLFAAALQYPPEKNVLLGLDHFLESSIWLVL